MQNNFRSDPNMSQINTNFSVLAAALATLTKHLAVLRVAASTQVSKNKEQPLYELFRPSKITSAGKGVPVKDEENNAWLFQTNLINEQGQTVQS